MKQGIGLIAFLLLFSCTTFEKNRTSTLQAKVDSLENELGKTKNHYLEANVKIEKPIAAEFRNEDFSSFFYSFMTDSVFQKSRVKFPFTYYAVDIDLMKDSLTTIQKNEWKYNPFYIDTATERTQIYDNFEMKFQPSNERLLHWYGVESGGNSKYYFIGYDGNWFLTKKWDSGI